MKQINPRIEGLKAMMSLEEKRSALQTQLDTVQQQLIALQSRFFDDSNPAKNSSPQSSPKVRSGLGKRARRGALSEKILSALSSAGEAGIRVKDLASAIGTKAANIHSWFQSTARRHPAIKKLSAGVYGLDSQIASKPAKTKADSKRGAVAKIAKKKSRTGKRGALAEKIVTALGVAGADGISIKDLAAKVGAEYKNISIWFATTGKKNSKIKKVGPARYKLAA